jgi:hypothetical protein
MQRIDVRASPILSCPLRCANTIGTAIRALHIGKVQQINKNPRKHLIGVANTPLFACRCGECTLLRL